MKMPERIPTDSHKSPVIQIVVDAALTKQLGVALSIANRRSQLFQGAVESPRMPL